jgi:hypothetical protein
VPHFVACRTKDDHRGVDRVADGAAEDVRSNHRHRSARRRSPNARPHSVIPVVGHRVTRAPTADRLDGAPPPVRDPCVPRMRYARERPA